MTTYDAKAIRKALESYGLQVFSVRKVTRRVGGRRFDLSERGLAMQSHRRGRPVFHYRVHLLSNGTDTKEKYDFAVEALKAEGYEYASHAPWQGLTIQLPYKVQEEFRKKVRR
jgi:hypothetical protein